MNPTAKAVSLLNMSMKLSASEPRIVEKRYFVVIIP
jgi:hypothetical protein